MSITWYVYISRLSLIKKPEKGSRTWSLKFLTEMMMGSLTLLSLWQVQVYNDKTTEKVTIPDAGCVPHGLVRITWGITHQPLQSFWCEWVGKSIIRYFLFNVSETFINHYTFSDGVISKPELKKLVPSVVKLVGHDDVNAVNNESCKSNDSL